MGVLRFDAFTLDLARHSLLRGDEELALRPQSFDVLRYLAENAGTVVSKDQLIEALWDNRPATDDSVMQCIKDIRQALGAGAHEIIRTVPKRGYLFAAEVVRESAVPERPLASAQADAATFDRQRAGWRARLSHRGFSTAGLVIAGLAALTIVGASAISHSLSSPKTEALRLMATPTVAVLPFREMGENPRQPGGFNTLADDIATELTSVGRGFNMLVRSVAPGAPPQKTGTRYVVLGNIHADANLRVNIQLVEAQSGQLVWAQLFDSAPVESGAKNHLATQIARLISQQLLMTESRRPLAAEPSADDYALLARGLLNGERGEKANADAQALFEKALGQNPDSIPALQGVARTILDAVLNGWVPADARSALLGRAEIAIQHVIDLAPRSLEGHLLRGVLARARQDNDQAIAAFEHALELNPNYPHAHAELGRALIDVGRAQDSGIHIKDAIDLSPTDSALYIWCYWAGMAAVHAGDYEAAVHWLRRSRQTNRSYDNTLLWLALAYAVLGRMEEAGPLLSEFLDQRPHFTLAGFALKPPHRNPVVSQQRVRIATLMVQLGVRESEVEGRTSN